MYEAEGLTEGKGHRPLRNNFVVFRVLLYDKIRFLMYRSVIVCYSGSDLSASTPFLLWIILLMKLQDNHKNERH